jgi:capsular exopolysaccharide synthesis family protein
VALAEPQFAERAALQPPPDFLEAEYAEVRPRNLRDYLGVLHKHRWLAALCFAVTVGLAVLYTLATPRLYTASTRLQVPRRPPIQLQLKGNVLNLEETDRSVNGASSFLATQVSALKSRDLAERVVRGQELAQNEAFRAAGLVTRGLRWLTGLWATQDDGSTAAGEEGRSLRAMAERLPAFLRPRNWDALPAGETTDHAADGAAIDARLLDRYMRSLSVQDVRGTDLIEVSFTTKSPPLSAFLAAAHTQAYLDANAAAQVLTDSAAIDFLARQLEQSRAQLDVAEAALGRFAAEHPNVAVNQEDKVVGKQIADLSSLVTEAEGARVAAHSQFEYLGAAKNEPLAHLLGDSPAIEKLRLALLDLGAQRSALADRLGPNHPQMVALRRQAREVEGELRAEVEREIAAARGRYQAAQMREDQLRSRLAQLEATAIELRELGAQYDLLKSELDNARTLHESLLKQKTETAVHSQLDAASVRVIERPEVPQRPSTPNVPVNLALGALAGLIVAAAATFLREALDPSVKSPEEVEDLLRLPTLAVIPNFALARVSANGRAAGSAHHAASSLRNRRPPGGNGHDLVVFNEPWSAVAETFRSLRTAVLFSAPADTDAPKVILVTSAGAGEGKTDTAVNLATALADAQWRVLLLDADLREPGCHHALGVGNQQGLSDFLSGRAELDGLIQQLDAPRLCFVAAGPTPPNPAELVGSARMREAIDTLRGRFDFLIVDSPPVIPVTDAVLLGREVDGVVLVVKGHDSPRELVREARDRLLQAGAHLLGVVVNNVDLHWGGFDYYHKRYDRYGRNRRPAAEEREGMGAGERETPPV